MPSLQHTPDPAAPPDDLEALRVRNYDVAAAHTLTVAATSSDASFRRRYYLAPGQTVSETGVLPAGTYDLAVCVDGVDRATRRVTVGPSRAETALVELGNGVTSVTQGGY